MKIKTGKYRKGIFIVTYCLEKDKPKYLLLERKLHWKGWEFPKGGVGFFESKRKAALREVKEETGLKPLKIKKFKIKGKYKYSKKLIDRKGIIGQTYVLFAVEVKKSKIKIDKKEHCSAKWFSFDKAMKNITYLNQRQCLRIVDDWLKNEKV